MDNKVQTDLLRRETEITAIRERSFLQIGWLTGFILLLLVISYIIIHLNTKRINRYKKETSELIRNRGTAETQRHAESVLQASIRMIAMLSSLLIFFRLESGKERMSIAPFRLQSVTDTLEAEFRPMAEDRDLKLTVENSAEVVLIGDKERIMQIGDNLLSNAIKYTQAGGVSFRSSYSMTLKGSSDHFRNLTKMVALGSGATREVRF